MRICGHGGEIIQKRKVVWLIAVIVFVVLMVTSTLAYNARNAEITERMKREYGIDVEPYYEPFWTTLSGRLLVFCGFALFISGLFVAVKE